MTNQFDSSYNTKLFVAVDPPQLSFSKEDFLNCGTVEPCSPSLRCESVVGGVLCDIGNPIRENQAVSGKLEIGLLCLPVWSVLG